MEDQVPPQVDPAGSSAEPPTVAPVPVPATTASPAATASGVTASPADMGFTSGPGAPEATAPAPAVPVATPAAPSAGPRGGSIPKLADAIPKLPTGTGAEWPGKAADLIVSTVDAVHDKVVRPLALAVRGLVYGIVAGAMGGVLAVLGAVMVVRILDVYVFGRRVWASDVVVGGVLALAGLALWGKRGSTRGA